MIKLLDRKIIYRGGELIDAPRDARCGGTIAQAILAAHNASGGAERLKIKFDEIVSHDITYVGIIQTAKASGLDEFPLPYTLTNCHNSLCAVGGTINEDDHVFGLSAAKKYGGAFVPPHLAVIHQYMRERRAKCGAMILGSDSHTRYGALGTLAIGEGGPELVKQLLGRTYDLDAPEVVAVYLKGKPRRGVGPHDVALAVVKATFGCGFVKNKIMEFVGPGIKNLSMDYRCGIDVMTTETACLSSIWETDEKTADYYRVHLRPEAYVELRPQEGACYAAAIEVDLSRVEPMIALPFHPGNAYTIAEFNANARDILETVEKAGEKLLGGKGTFRLTDKIRNGRVYVDQGVVAGCAGGLYENIAAAADILKDKSLCPGEFSLNIYPASQPIYKCLADNGYAGELMARGAILKTAFCGPCFGAGDVPAAGGLSVRHTTRNFESREGSKPADGQLAAVALMDARSIAATALNGGAITAATEADYREKARKYCYCDSMYEARVYDGIGRPQRDFPLRYGPNIADWPAQSPLKEHLLIRVASVLTDPVTTTDELIPSGETSSYRSNPLKLSEFALSRKDPAYVGRAKAIKAEKIPFTGLPEGSVTYGSAVCAVRPGDGSAREQAASCQRVLGGVANIAVSYATKRYRSNVINWGMFPFVAEKNDFEVGDLILVRDARAKLLAGETEFEAEVVGKRRITLSLGALTGDERKIIADGCLINFYAAENQAR